MSTLYTPLNSDGPAIPTLNQLRTGAHTVDVEMPALEEIPQTMPPMKSKPLVVESVAVLTITETAAVAPADRWLVRSCCCGCSLATGVWLIAFLEAASWCTGIVAGIFALVLESQKKQIDSAIENADSEDASEDAPADSTAADSTGKIPEDLMTTDEKVSKVNAAIDAFAIASPFLLAMALVGLFFACKGFAASRGDAAACRSYLWWRKVCVVYAAVALVLGEGGVVSLLAAVYCAVVVKSLGAALAQRAAAAAEAPTTTVVAVMSGV